MPAMRPADDGDLRQQLSMRALSRDRHRVCGRFEIPVAEDSVSEDRADDEPRRCGRVGARFHRSLGIGSR